MSSMEPGVPEGSSNGTSGPRRRGRAPERRKVGPLGDPWMEELTRLECLELLEKSEVGRVAVMVGDFPVVLPVNHRVVGLPDRTVVVMQTRPGNVIYEAPEAAAYQVDGYDAARRQGWSVLVRGRLRRADPLEELAEHVATQLSWLTNRQGLMVIEVVEVTGRRLHGAPHDWPFHPHAYI